VEDFFFPLPNNALKQEIIAVMVMQEHYHITTEYMVYEH